MNKAFTLIELSIVLVIIGLLAGGIIVGTTLIKAAEIRASISQVESFNTAAMTFKLKYNGLPGDLSNATGFGFTYRAGTLGQGNNNGLIDLPNGFGGANLCAERLLFWADLFDAGLIADTSSTAVDRGDGIAGCLSANVLTFEEKSQYIPKSKLGRKAFVAIISFTGGTGNGYTIGDVHTITSTFGAVSRVNPTYSPIEALAIDTKLDDGLATTGKVKAWRNLSTPDTTTACLDTALTPINYATADNSISDTYICTLNISTPF